MLIGASSTATLSISCRTPLSRSWKSSTFNPVTARPPSVTSASTLTTSTPLRKRCADPARSEEHTSELQSHSDLVCRLLLEKKNGGERMRDLGIAVGEAREHRFVSSG